MGLFRAVRSLALRRGACTLLALAAVQAAGAQEPLAPDGRLGLGGARTARGYTEIFLSPTEADEELLTHLAELDSEVRILAEMARRGYRERGYFRLLDRFGPQDLESLHARYRELAGRAATLVEQESEEARLWSDLYVDLRFRARLDLLDAFEREARYIRDGLALLRAAAEGYAQFKDREARAIAERVDLSAALLRAIRSDLTILRDRGDADAPGEPDPAWKVEWIGIGKLRDEAERVRALERLDEKIAARARKLESVLFTPRLRAKLADELRRREVFLERAGELLEEAKVCLYELPEGVDPPPDLQKLSKYERYQLALRKLLDGVGHDPFDDDLVYRAGLATDFLYDFRESRQWYDRFLALRGVRMHLSQTTEGELDEQEREAVNVMLRGGLAPGR